MEWHLRRVGEREERFGRLVLLDRAEAGIDGAEQPRYALALIAAATEALAARQRYRFLDGEPGMGDQHAAAIGAGGDHDFDMLPLVVLRGEAEELLRRRRRAGRERQTEI